MVLCSFLFSQAMDTTPPKIAYPQSQQILIEETIKFNFQDSLRVIDSTWVENWQLDIHGDSFLVDQTWKYIHETVAWVDTLVVRTVSTKAQWQDSLGQVVPWATKTFDHQIYDQAELGGMGTLLDRNFVKMKAAVNNQQ